MRPIARPARISQIAHANLLVPPEPAQQVTFTKGFGPRSLLTVDTEEEFDWNAPFRADGYGLDHVRAISGFQEFCEGLQVTPVYLVDWPIANDPLARDIIGDAVRAGKAEIGVQLHPWVNPPFSEEVSTHNSYAGNLPPDLEEAKYRKLRDKIEESFGTLPRIYRAGRYGLGPQTTRLLSETGVAIDSSVRAHFDYSAFHGPDYSRHPLTPYWTDAGRKLIELPLTTVFWGLLRRQAPALFPLATKYQLLGSALARLGLLERISLTPEGVTAEEALRAVDIAIDDGLPVLVLSFHSPSLQKRHTPYVRDENDLDALYDWFRAVYGYLHQRGVRPTTVAEIMRAVDA